MSYYYHELSSRSGVCQLVSSNQFTATEEICLAYRWNTDPALVDIIILTDYPCKVSQTFNRVWNLEKMQWFLIYLFSGLNQQPPLDSWTRVERGDNFQIWRKRWFKDVLLISWAGTILIIVQIIGWISKKVSKQTTYTSYHKNNKSKVSHVIYTRSINQSPSFIIMSKSYMHKNLCLLFLINIELNYNDHSLYTYIGFYFEFGRD